MNILVYDPAKDGKTILVLDKHDPSHARLVKDGQVAIGVRVQPHINEYSQNAWTDSHVARLILTGWLTGDGLPEDIVLGDECELRDPVDDGAIVRCRRQDLAAEEVREHVNAGKQVVQLAIAYDGRLQCVLAEDLTVRKLRFEDVVTEQLGDVAGEDAIAELDARFALMTGELTRLFERMEALFDLG